MFLVYAYLACCAFFIVGLLAEVISTRRESTRFLNLYKEERNKRQDEINEHFSTKDALLEAESRILELESLTTKASGRSEGYSGIITKLLDASRKASDEYEKVRRQKT